MMIDILLILIAIGIGLPLLSFIVEALRPAPSIPTKLRWAPDLPIQYVEINGLHLRYIKTGDGPILILLHTLRTQLDLFEKMIPKFAEDFTVYAFDLPGHGYSDIPDTTYNAQFFADITENFLETFDLQDVMLAGVSIGGAIPLIIASSGNPRVTRVVAINPYDYAQGRGMARSSVLAGLIVAAADIPVLGETIMRLRNFFIIKNVLEGGVSNPHSIPPQLLKEMYLAGNRKGHYRAFINLLRNADSWQSATKDYFRINIPVLFLWGDQDWANSREREHDRQLVPDAEMITIEKAGHFLPLDQPDELIKHLREFYQHH
jgi:pimeloyl-ACP methyl ester carboxylesterase